MKEIKTVWYEVRMKSGSMCNKFNSEARAREEIGEAKNGYPKNYNMHIEDRNYWKKVSSKMVVHKITQIDLELK